MKILGEKKRHVRNIELQAFTLFRIKAKKYSEQCQNFTLNIPSITTRVYPNVSGLSR